MAKYNDIPILTKVLTVDSPELYGSRNKQQEVEDFILSELNEVYAKLPLQSELNSDEAGRVTQGAALALKRGLPCLPGLGRSITSTVRTISSCCNKRSMPLQK